MASASPPLSLSRRPTAGRPGRRLTSPTSSYLRLHTHSNSSWTPAASSTLSATSTGSPSTKPNNGCNRNIAPHLTDEMRGNSLRREHRRTNQKLNHPNRPTTPGYRLSHPPSAQTLTSHAVFGGTSFLCV